MTFQPGNQEAKKGDRTKARVITQQLTSALNEAYEGGVPKIRKVIDAWIANAIGGDQAAINAIADRMDGKPAQESTLTVRSELDYMNEHELREFIRRELAASGAGSAEAEELTGSQVTH